LAFPGVATTPRPKQAAAPPPDIYPPPPERKYENPSLVHSSEMPKAFVIYNFVLFHRKLWHLKTHLIVLLKS
jgi:hypothetical protein